VEREAMGEPEVFVTLNVQRQYPLVLLVKAGW
jgi:hypothetical protein